ncbi:YeeE/YedE family protein [Alkaliphilus sp. MSJ-5]|uniref:YeeE/YedE family protein n=1 Tax=Alkaliphilus flagellatus TaxID=2841507 RepID=A0ABS6FZ58_9FIRM|nr:YeeE/YedE thiosulfate transporter family protein [Alkaliphilus flagellatus]MBU5675535.1 YeeE/YedE family protein [Alkaliphilus flagellatus]
MNLKDKLFKKPWPYWVGGIILALLNILLLFTTGSAWKISTSFLYIGSAILDRIGINTNDWYYFNVYTNQLKPEDTYLNNRLIVMAVAIILGSLLSVLFVSEFKFKKIKNKKQLVVALIGGILMGYGSRLSFGCNVGAYFSAIPSFSVHGWVFGAFMFVGAWVGSKILFKYIL